MDLERFGPSPRHKGITFTQQEILARATLACNVLRANKKLCPFELAKGYMPAIAGFAQTPVESEVADAHVEQVTRRALKKDIRRTCTAHLSKIVAGTENQGVFLRKEDQTRSLEYVAFFLWFSWPYMASFMATTPAVPSLRLRLPCNLGIYYLLALTAPAFAVSGRFQPFLEIWGCSLLSLACLSQHRSVDCVYSP